MFRLNGFHLLLVTFYKFLRSFKEFTSAFHIELFSFYLHSIFDLFLKHLSILVETSLTQVFCPLLHLDYAGWVMQSVRLNSAILYWETEIIEFLLLLFLEFHLDQSCFIFVLWQYYVIPFVLEFSNLSVMSVFKRLHFLFMATESFIFAFLFLENSELLQPLSRLACLFQFAFTFTIFAMLVQNLKEVFGYELWWVKGSFATHNTTSVSLSIIYCLSVVCVILLLNIASLEERVI